MTEQLVDRVWKDACAGRLTADGVADWCTAQGVPVTAVLEAVTARLVDVADRRAGYSTRKAAVDARLEATRASIRDSWATSDAAQRAASQARWQQACQEHRQEVTQLWDLEQADRVDEQRWRQVERTCRAAQLVERARRLTTGPRRSSDR